MSNETQKVSVQIPTEVLKEVSAAVEKAKTTNDDKTSVTLQFSPEAVNALTALRKDFVAFQEGQVAGSHAAADRFIKTSEMRIAFYEKLILLAGGSFALSLTFLGSLHRVALPTASPLLAMNRLKTAWVLLLVCIVFSWLHNLYRAAAVDHASAANATFVTSMQHTWTSYLLSRAAALFRNAESPSVGFSDGITLVAQSFEELSKKSKEAGSQRAVDLKRFYYVAGVLGSVALLSIIVAFSFMILFAVKNAALL
jgi:hypothetical protein